MTTVASTEPFHVPGNGLCIAFSDRFFLRSCRSAPSSYPLRTRGNVTVFLRAAAAVAGPDDPILLALLRLAGGAAWTARRASRCSDGWSRFFVGARRHDAPKRYSVNVPNFGEFASPEVFAKVARRAEEA